MKCRHRLFSICNFFFFIHFSPIYSFNIKHTTLNGFRCHCSFLSRSSHMLPSPCDLFIQQSLIFFSSIFFYLAQSFSSKPHCNIILCVHINVVWLGVFFFSHSLSLLARKKRKLNKLHSIQPFEKIYHNGTEMAVTVNVYLQRNENSFVFYRTVN